MPKHADTRDACWRSIVAVSIRHSILSTVFEGGPCRYCQYNAACEDVNLIWTHCRPGGWSIRCLLSCAGRGGDRRLVGREDAQRHAGGHRDQRSVDRHYRRAGHRARHLGAVPPGPRALHEERRRRLLRRSSCSPGFIDTAKAQYAAVCVRRAISEVAMHASSVPTEWHNSPCQRAGMERCLHVGAIFQGSYGCRTANCALVTARSVCSS